MSQKSWEQQLCSLIKKIKHPVNAKFRNDYRELVQKASEGRILDKTGVQLLDDAREWLEECVAPAADPATAFAKWMRLFDAGARVLPVSTFEALLRRFPRTTPEQLDWIPFILKCPNQELIWTLLDKGLVAGNSLDGLVEQRFDELYQTVALDVLVERSALRNPRAVWVACAARGRRRAGLMHRAEMLIRCWACDTRGDSNSVLLEHLLSSSDDRPDLLRCILGEHQPVIRFAWYLANGLAGPSSRPRFEPGTTVEALLADWASVCAAEMDRAAPDRAGTAAVILGILRLSASTPCIAPEAIGAGGRADILSCASEAAAVRMLRQANGRPEEQQAGPVVLFCEELNRAMLAHLDWLPLGTRLGEDSPEKRLRFERYVATKRVIDLVLYALEATTDGGRLRGELEVALFNCGVRPVGAKGEVVAFDGRIHHPEVPGMLPGEPAVVTFPGRRLDEGPEHLVFVKARVKRSVDEALACEIEGT